MTNGESTKGAGHEKKNRTTARKKAVVKKKAGGKEYPAGEEQSIVTATTTIRRETMADEENIGIGTATTAKVGIGENIGKTGTTVKDGIVGSLKGINEIEAEIVTLVRDTVSNASR